MPKRCPHPRFPVCAPPCWGLFSALKLQTVNFKVCAMHPTANAQLSRLPLTVIYHIPKSCKYLLLLYIAHGDRETQAKAVKGSSTACIAVGKCLYTQHAQAKRYQRTILTFMLFCFRSRMHDECIRAHKRLHESYSETQTRNPRSHTACDCSQSNAWWMQTCVCQDMDEIIYTHE